MTIVSVAFVPEGIAMAADSRLTGTQRHENGDVQHFTFTDNAQKLILIRDSTIGVSFYGDAIIEGKTVADLMRHFDIHKVSTSDSVETVAHNLKAYLNSNYAENTVMFLLAGYDEDEPRVYNVDKHTVAILNQGQDGVLSYGISWRGDERILRRLFHQAELNFNLMPLKDAVDLAEFAVETTVNFLRFEDCISTCGGPIDLAVITKDYAKFVRHKILNP